VNEIKHNNNKIGLKALLFGIVRVFINFGSEKKIISNLSVKKSTSSNTIKETIFGLVILTFLK
jgi:hypothetical protein